MINVFCGWDSREQLAYEVCRQSLAEHSSVPVNVIPLKHRELRKMGLFDRPWRIDEKGQYWDERDGLPFSTEFSHTRFLVPALADRMGIKGWALFCDCDFLWRADVAELMELADPSKPLMVVKHEHRPREAVKMDGMAQTSNPRKNWSSLMLFNLDFPPGPWRLNTGIVNHASGSHLHSLGQMNELIGPLPKEWNWLAGYDDPIEWPKAVHFTLGTPDMDGYGDQPYAAEWWAMAERIRHPRPTVALRLQAAE